jgi:hypothetical protein
VFHFAHLLGGWTNVLDQWRMGVLTVSSLIRPVRFHRERARHFNRHAAHTKNPDGREMYLRLAGQEVALAEQNEHLAKLELEHEVAGSPRPTVESLS